MVELLVATTNQGKLREIKELLKESALKITSLADYPNIPPVEEDGRTFAQNALKKAVTAALYTQKLTLAEDSGLEVRALKNKPGIYSARFSGENSTDLRNNLKLLRLLKDIPFDRRQARYRCVAALVDGTTIRTVVEGRCEGIIAARSKGKNGFGYDPLFLIPKHNKTFGELEPDIKAVVSHRAKALAKIKRYFQTHPELLR